MKKIQIMVNFFSYTYSDKALSIDVSSWTTAFS